VQIKAEERVYGMDKPAWWVRSGELSGIFNWAVKGLRRLQEKNKFTEPSVCQEALEQYRVDCNPAQAYLLEACREEEKGSVPTNDLYSDYSLWCDQNGYQPLGSAEFGKVVVRTFPKITKKRVGGRASDRKNAYQGIDMTNPRKWGSLLN
jgi:phage/plasmid-associated DNA primase